MLFRSQRLAQHADQVMRLLGTAAPQAPSAFSQLLGTLWMRHVGVTQIVVTGDRPDLVQAVQRRWLPHGVLAWGQRLDGPLWADRPDGFAYVCRDHVCQLPVNTTDALAAQLL